MFRITGRTYSLCTMAALLFTFAFTASAQVGTGSHARGLITQEINENNMVTLQGNTRPEANAINDRGAVADDLTMDHMMLQLQRSPEQEAALEKLIDEMQTKGSSNYHRWMTAPQFAENFGVAKEDVAKITSWLASQGFHVNVAYPTLIDFSGTAGQVHGAFRTSIHNLDVKGV